MGADNYYRNDDVTHAVHVQSLLDPQPIMFMGAATIENTMEIKNPPSNHRWRVGNPALLKR
jgi:hypothetical protein